jgi:hypothetical protein
MANKLPIGGEIFLVMPVDDSGNPLPSGGGPANRAGFATDQQTVATAGVGVQLQAQAIPNGFSVFIRALPTNVGNVYVGNSQANAENHAVAEVLEPGAFLEYFITNVDLIWIDADTNGSILEWTVEV